MSQLRVEIYVQVRFDNCLEGNPHATIRFIVKEHLVAVDPDQSPAKIPLITNRPLRLDLGKATRETFVIRPFVKTSIQAGRRNFEGVGRVDEVFDVQNRPQMQTHFGAILMSNACRFIDEDADDRFVIRAGNFGVD